MGDEQEKGTMVRMDRSVNLEVHADTHEQEVVNNPANMALQNENANQIMNNNLNLRQDAMTEAEKAEILDKLEEFGETFKKLLREESVNSDNNISDAYVNYTNRLIHRDVLVQNMCDAIKYTKRNLGSEVQTSNWTSAAELLAQAQSMKESILQEDAKLEILGEQAQNMNEADAIMDDIMDDTHFTDSGYYSAVCDAVRSYKQTKNDETLAALKQAVGTYIDKRSNHGNKTKFSTEKGKRRMERMKQLSDRLNSIKDLESTELKESEIVADIVESGVKKDNEEKEKNRVKTELAKMAGIDKDCALQKECAQLVINNKMLDFNYVKEHPEELRNIIDIMKNAKENIDAIQADEEKREVYPQYDIYMFVNRKANEIITKYARLEDYVNLCLSKEQSDKDVEKLRKKLPYLELTDEKVKTCKEYCERYYIKRRNFDYILKLYPDTSKAKVDDWKRFASMCGDWNVNENGEFASDKDREMFEKDVKFLKTLLSGTDEECFDVLKEYYDELPILPINDETISIPYFEKNMVNLYYPMQKILNTENVFKVRGKVGEKVKQMYPEIRDYIKKSDDIALYHQLFTTFVSMNYFIIDGNILNFSSKEENDSKLIQEKSVFESLLEMMKEELKKK